VRHPRRGNGGEGSSTGRPHYETLCGKSEHSQEWLCHRCCGSTRKADLALERLKGARFGKRPLLGRAEELWFRDGHVHDGFCASYVVEVIVGAHRDGMFAGSEFAQREFVAFFESVADVPGRRD
jgi:hypothetical protein